MPRLSDYEAGHAIRAIRDHNINPSAVGSKHQIPCPVCSMERVKSTATPCGAWVADEGRVNFVCQHCDLQGFVDVHDGSAAAPQQDRNRERPPPKPKEYQRPKRHPVALEWDEQMRNGLATRNITEAVRLQFGLIKTHYYMGKDDAGEWVKVLALGFPYYDGKELVLVKYRLFGGKKVFKQSPKPAPSIYNINGLRDHLASNPAIKTAVVCEGEFDCMALATCGVTNAVTTNLGASKTNNAHSAHLFATSDEMNDCEDIMLAGDGDAVGRALMNQIADAVGRSRCKVVDWTHHCTSSCVRLTGEKDKKGELKLDADGKPLTRVCKDAGDVLVNHGQDCLINCLDLAKKLEEIENG